MARHKQPLLNDSADIWATDSSARPIKKTQSGIPCQLYCNDRTGVAAVRFVIDPKLNTDADSIGHYGDIIHVPLTSDGWWRAGSKSWVADGFPNAFVSYSVFRIPTPVSLPT